MNWKDATSYSRDDKERLPTTFAATSGPLKLVVTSGHIYYPGRWVGHCQPLFEAKLLDATTLEEAQDEVVRLVREWVNAASAGLNS